MEEGEYRDRLARVHDPKTPRRVALGLLRDMRPAEIARITRNMALPADLRRAAEGVLVTKLPSLPLGVKVTLARLVSEDVLKALLLEGGPTLVKACFDNPCMKEEVALWALNHSGIPAGVVEFIAGSPRWSVRYPVRLAMLRNPNTPVETALGLVGGMKSQDLRYLYGEKSVSMPVKVQIEVELERRDQSSTL